MLKPNIKRSEGFTIIEVLIVLAIAGLILLIVFLAVPALQRNARNTQVKNGASAVLGAVNEFVDNNNGQLPTGGSIAADGTITITGGSGTTTSTGKTQSGYSASFGTTMPTTAGQFVINTNHTCNNNAFSTSTTPRAIAIGYVVETSGSSTAPQCTES